MTVGDVQGSELCGKPDGLKWTTSSRCISAGLPMNWRTLQDVVCGIVISPRHEGREPTQTDTHKARQNGVLRSLN